jgi:hypothetical protein
MASIPNRRHQTDPSSLLFQVSDRIPGSSKEGLDFFHQEPASSNSK